MIDTSQAVKKLHSLAKILNDSYDPETGTLKTTPVGSDGQEIQRMNANNMSYNSTVDGTITYFCRAKPGTALSDPLWQCFKIDEATGLRITWADGNSEFDNEATDPSSLTYS